MHSALRWLPQASLIKHAFEALCINEFKGLEFEADERGGGMRTGREASNALKWGVFAGLCCFSYPTAATVPTNPLPLLPRCCPLADGAELAVLQSHKHPATIFHPAHATFLHIAAPSTTVNQLSAPLLHSNPTGDDVLNWLSFGHTSIPKTLGSEARILAFYYWLTYCILRAGKPKFEAIQPPPAAAAANGAAAAGANKQQQEEEDVVPAAKAAVSAA